MCKWGTDEIVTVYLPAELSHTGEARWADKGIDSCIAPIVKALTEAGIYTASSCCGHEKSNGLIFLHDGRWLEIHPSKDRSWEI